MVDTQIGGNEMKQYRVLLAISIFLVIVMAILLYYSERKLILKNAIMEEQNITEISKEVIKSDVEDAIRDLRFFTRVYESHLDETDDSAFFRNTSYNFFMFVKEEMRYDQMRFIQKDGKEVISINYNNGTPEFVQESALQNRSEATYFQKAISLDYGEVHICPLQLKKNGLMVASPVQPMNYIASPVFNRDGEVEGIIVLNYMADQLIRHFEFSVARGQREYYLLNEKGYYLSSPTAEKNWGFMYPNRSRDSLMYDNPKVFRKIQQDTKGYFFEDGNLYVYQQITYPAQWHVKTDEKLYVLTKLTHKQLHQLLLPLKLRTIVGTIIIIIGVIIIYAISEKSVRQERSYQQSLEKLVTEDSLTKVGNRFRCHKMLEEKMKRRRPFIFCYLDMDRFKAVNDTFGHAVGDELLIYLANQMKKAVKDQGEVFRLGGDEFSIVLHQADEKTKQDVTKAVEAIFAKPIYIDGNHCDVGISIGCSYYPEDGNTIDKIMTKADESMYEEKSKHRRYR